MSIIHFIDASEPARCPSTLAVLTDLIGQTPDFRHIVITSGAEAARAARAVGLKVDHQIPGLGLKNPAALLKARKLLVRYRGAAEEVRFHVMSPSGLALIAGLVGAAPCLVTLASDKEVNRWSLRHRRLVRRNHTVWLVMDLRMRDALVRHGAAADGVFAAAPGLDAGRLQGASRRALRLKLGVADERTMLVAAVGGSPASVDALQATLAGGLARETGRDLRILISPRASGVERARRVMRSSDRMQVAIFCDLLDRPWSVLPACDAALAQQWGLGAAWAMAAGLPIAGTSTGELAQTLFHGRAALLVPPKGPGQYARWLNRLHDDRVWGTELGTRARQIAHGMFDVHRFAATWRDAMEVSRADGPVKPAAGPGKESTVHRFMPRRAG